MTASKSDSLSIVLIYASGDKQRVKPVDVFLKSESIKVWTIEDVLPGQRPHSETEKAFDNADLILIGISTRSLHQEGFVQRVEKMGLDKAQEKPQDEIFVIPLRLDDCEIPSSLKRWIPVDLVAPDWQGRLMKSIGLRASRLGKAIHSPGMKDPTGQSKAKKHKDGTIPEMLEPPVSCFWPRARKPLPSLMNHRNLPNWVGGNPFPHLEAESDRQYLFSKQNFFWNGHPLLQRLRQKHEITVVTGYRGVGKTAFARAHGIYLIDRYTFSCFFAQSVPALQAQRHFAEIALDFITDNPFYLPSSQAELELLANWLAANLGKLIIPAQISRAITHFEEAAWFIDAGARGRRQEWKRQAEAILGRLREVVENVDLQENNLRSWHMSQQCITSLGFNKIRTVFDLKRNLTDDQIIDLQNFIDEHAARAEIVLFGQTGAHWIEDLMESGASIEDLTWSSPERLLEKMARHRWGLVCKDPLEAMFQRGALALLFERANENPRRFIQLWNNALNDLRSPGRKITVAGIEKADR